MNDRRINGAQLLQLEEAVVTMQLDQHHHLTQLLMPASLFALHNIWHNQIAGWAGSGGGGVFLVYMYIQDHRISLVGLIGKSWYVTELKNF